MAGHDRLTPEGKKFYAQIDKLAENEVFIGRDLAHARSYGESVATAIDSEVKRIIDECYEKAKKIILEHENVLHKCCELLLEKEKISQDEFEALFE